MARTKGSVYFTIITNSDMGLTYTEVKGFEKMEELVNQLTSDNVSHVVVKGRFHNQFIDIQQASNA